MGSHCHCHTCDKDFHPLGVARHRAMHRDRMEDCCITYTNGATFKHRYSTLAPTVFVKSQEKARELFQLAQGVEYYAQSYLGRDGQGAPIKDQIPTQDDMVRTIQELSDLVRAALGVNLKEE